MSWTVGVEYAIAGALSPVLADCLELSDRQTAGSSQGAFLYRSATV